MARQPAAVGQQVGEMPQHGRHAPQRRAVLGVPGIPTPEDVLPDEHPAAVEPGRRQFLLVRPVPAVNLVLHVARLDPLQPQHADARETA